ncbi:transglutaminase domain-containing protein [candidate division KSB1 bacterium]|nr:transglutaminase domain-containing protein [candidate division KSB1 bacterium]
MGIRYVNPVSWVILTTSIACLPIGAQTLETDKSAKEVHTSMLEYYRTQSEWTNPGTEEDMYRGIPNDIPSIVKAVQGALIRNLSNPTEAQDKGWEIRRTEELLRRIRELHDEPVVVTRPVSKRLLVNCRQFSVLTCSILRHNGIPARARAGYVVFPAAAVIYENHWICEYWEATEQRWIQIDAQVNQIDIPEGRFVTAGEGWRRYRQGEAEPGTFGVSRNSIGWEMIVGNITCDAMALNKTELLPWDVNPHWSKKKEDLPASDVSLIDEAAALCREVDSRWEELRDFYDTHPIIRMPANFENK